MAPIPPVATWLSLAAILLQAAASNQGTVRGRILDADGIPIAGALVTVLEMVDGEFRSTRSLTASADGRFAAVVNAGRIMLKAQPRAMIVGDEPRLRRFVTHPPAYFPGVLDERDAWPIDVRPGEIVEFDFTMPPVPVGSIKTILSGPDGYALDHVRVTRPEAQQIRTVKMADNGTGYVEGLREGRYIVSARARFRDEWLAAWAIVHLISGEMTVALDLQPAARVHGRILSERDGLPPFANTRVTAAWTDGTIDLDPLARDESPVSTDGSFSIDGIFGTRVFRVAGLAAGWQIVAVRHGRSDISSGIDLAPGSTTEVAIIVARR